MLMWLLSTVESDIIQPERRGLLSITSKYYDKSSGWTQAELGQRLKVKDSAISKYENGSLQLSGDLLVQLADIFGVSTDYILGRTKYRTYEGTSFEVPKIIDLLSRGDMEMISNWAELSPENQARIADYAKILQKAEAADKNKNRMVL